MKIIPTAVCTLALAPAVLLAGITPAPVDKNPVAPPITVDPCDGPISYSNVELIYEYTDFDDSTADSGNGATLRYEFEATKDFYIKVDADYDSFDVTETRDTANFGRSFDVDRWSLSVGVGGHIALTENIHLAGDAGFTYTDVSSSYTTIPGALGGRRYDDSDTGWYISPHIRAKWGCLTVHVGASYQDLGDDADEWSGYGRIYYQIMPSLDLTAGYRAGEETETLSAGVRWRF